MTKQRIDYVIDEINSYLPFKLKHNTSNAGSRIGHLINNLYKYHLSDEIYQRDILFAALTMFAKHLHEVKNYDELLFKKFRKELIRSKDTDSFYGTRFELATCRSLIIRRQVFIKQESPDFSIDNSKCFIECTSARIEKAKSDMKYKIESAIHSKSLKLYANRQTALFIDTTNIHFNSLTVGDPFTRTTYQSAIDSTQANNNYGSTILFQYVANRRTGHFEFNYSRFDNENIGTPLRSFLDTNYPFGHHLVTNPALPREG